jgi:hypothetical protein
LLRHFARLPLVQSFHAVSAFPIHAAINALDTHTHSDDFLLFAILSSSRLNASSPAGI